MDTLWFYRYKRGGGESGPLEWEFSVGLGKRLFEAVVQRELSPRWAPLTNNVMHWGYGLGWGGVFGIAASSTAAPPMLLGLPFGAVVWVTSYIVLPLAGLYRPIWEYDAGTLWQDLSAHLVYGLTTATTFGLLSRLGPRPKTCLPLRLAAASLGKVSLDGQKHRRF
jgi:uncharacterized membrane protein YagU involved in acid resistance